MDVFHHLDAAFVKGVNAELVFAVWATQVSKLQINNRRNDFLLPISDL